MDDKLIRKMFNTSKIPIIDFGLGDMSRKAQRLAGKMSISGVQPKLSVQLDKKRNLLIPVAEGGEYILKPQVTAFPNIPENEQCCMDIASAMDIDVPLHCLIPLKDGSLAYVVKRFDRIAGEKIPQEDFCQILGLGTEDKYKGSVEQIGRKLKEISTGYDVQLFFERVVFNFIIGNGDAHFKNYSVTYKEKEFIRLAPAYDIICSKLVIPDETDSALTINGKNDKLKKDDFDRLADYLNVPAKIRYVKFDRKLNLIEAVVKDSRLKADSRQEMIDIIKERFSRLELL